MFNYKFDISMNSNFHIYMDEYRRFLTLFCKWHFVR